MTVRKIVGSAGTAPGMDNAFPSEPWESRTSRFTVHWFPSAAVVTAHGELDAANAAQLANYVERCAAFSERVVLDLSELEFFGTAGFSALHLINVRCAGADVQWTVVPNHLVSRLLRICDPDNTLPLCDSVADVVADEEPRRLLELISEPR